MPSRTFEYAVSLTRDGGRLATVRAGDRPPIATAPPADFDEGDDDRWSPEHLFLAAVQSCTMLSFLAQAEHYDVEVLAYECEIEGTIMRRAEDGRYAFVHVRQVPRVTVAAGRRAAAREIVGKAERDCFVSASTTADMVVDWDIREL